MGDKPREHGQRGRGGDRTSVGTTHGLRMNNSSGLLVCVEHEGAPTHPAKAAKV